MLSLKNEALEDSVSLASPEVSVAQELQFWQTFAFDMDREQHSNSRNSRNPQDPRNPQRSRSTSTSNTTGQHPHMNTGGPSSQDAALLAQFAAATGGGDLNQAYSNMMPQNPYPSMGPTPGFYGNFLHHGSMPAQLPPLSSLGFPWHNAPTQQPQASTSHYDPRQQNPSTAMPPLPYIDTQYSSSGPRSSDQTRDSKRVKPSSSSTTTTNEGHSTSSPEVEQTEAERNAIADEKRRRNTAASARFRVKKKHKTIGLERSVSDLTGRAEELEREAADLRRENGWLKEIVMLKGTRFAANNAAHREALTQAAALAAGGYADTTMEGPSGSGSGAGSSRPVKKSESGSSESESSDTEDKKSKKKGKGKKATTKKK